jgi:aryl-alcohol dehydrogenase-like predicted oxidoreductase
MVLSRKGKIKHIGLSNENAWGIMILEENKYHNLPRVKQFKILIRF